MKKLSTHISSVAFAVAALAASVAVNDAVALPFNVTDTQIAGAKEQTLSFNGFDIAGSDLVGVQFQLTGLQRKITAGLATQWTNPTTTTQRAEGQATGFFSVLLASSLPLFQDSLTTTPILSCVGPPGGGNCITPPITTFGLPIAGPSPVTITDPAILAALTGPSVTFDVTIRAETLVDFCRVSVPAQFIFLCAVIGESNWTGDLGVTFLSRVRDPQVPAPATLGLLGTAALGLGALRRRG